MTLPLQGHRLRRRLAVAFTGLAAVAAILVSLGFWVSEYFIEEATLDDRLAAELDRFVASGASSPSPSALYPQLRLYRLPEAMTIAPAHLATLAAGSYHRDNAKGQEETVLVREVGPGGKAILVYADEQAPIRRQWLAVAIVFATVLTGVISLWLARRLASQTLAPLDDLVQTLTRLDPEARGQRLPHSEADSELSVIIEAMNGYMSRLDDVVERERAFTAAASHELRTPLAVIQSSAELLADQGRVSPHVERIHRAADAAARHLDTLLWLSRSGTLQPMPAFRLDQQLIALCAEHVDVARVQWHLEPCLLAAPPGAVAVIVTNLLRNALKASPAPDSVRVDLDQQQLTVTDLGTGIPPQLSTTLFQLGVSSGGGSGMGLYIAQVLSSRQGWLLSLENRPAGGVRALLNFDSSVK